MFKSICVVVFLNLMACNPPVLDLGSSVALEGSRCGSVAEFGAIPDDGLDDRPAIQEAINACAAADGGTVTVPNGLYTLTKAPGSYTCLTLESGVHLQGESRGGTILQQVAGIEASVAMFWTNAAVDSSITDITLDGNKALQTVSTHRHGLFTKYGSTRLTIERVTSQNFTGDGFYLYNGAFDSTFRDVRSAHNDRNGITLSTSATLGTIDGVNILDSQFVGNAAQQIDSEPGPDIVIRNIHVSGCLLDSLSSPETTDYVMTIAGGNTAGSGDGWTAINNRINGPVLVVWFRNVVLANNVIRNPSAKASVWIYRSSSSVLVTGNYIENTTTELGGNTKGVIDVIATGVGNQPDDIVVTGNVIKANHPAFMGIQMTGVLRATVTGNSFFGGGASPFYAGMRVRATYPVKSIILTGNNVRNFVKGIDVVTPSNLQTMVVTGNTFDDLPLVWP